MKRVISRMLRRVFGMFRRHDVVHFIPRLPVGLELSDGDRAALYGWPDCRVEDVDHDIS